jgi:hypothetical protein
MGPTSAGVREGRKFLAEDHYFLSPPGLPGYRNAGPGRACPHYGQESVFTDIDSIPLGTDFLEHLNAELATCDAMIAVVGPRWLDGGLGAGHGVHEETDFVRIEVEAALKRKIPVIPALVSGATMPKPAELPEVLRGFAFRNGTAIDSGVNFRNDINRLIRSLDETFANKKSTTGASRPARDPPVGQHEQRRPSADPPPSAFSASAPPPQSRFKRILWKILKPIPTYPTESIPVKLLKGAVLTGIYLVYAYLLAVCLAGIGVLLGILR